MIFKVGFLLLEKMSSFVLFFLLPKMNCIVIHFIVTAIILVIVCKIRKKKGDVKKKIKGKRSVIQKGENPHIRRKTIMTMKCNNRQ